jgi:GTPase
MMWKRRSVCIRLNHAILWLILHHTRIRGFQFDGVGSLADVNRGQHRRPMAVVACRVEGTRSTRWGQYARSILYSVPSSSQVESSDASSPPSSASSQHSQSRTNSQLDPPSSRNHATLNSPLTSSSSSSSPAFYDQAILNVRAGSGGSGATMFELLNSNGGGGLKRKQQGAPNGGSGGRGGHVILQVDADLNTLVGLAVRQGKHPAGSVVLRAENGMDGQGRKRSGAPGRDVVLRVPPGTIVEELVTSQDEDSDGKDEEWVELGRLALLKQTHSTSFDAEDRGDADPNDDSTLSSLIIARGGRGGDGNSVYANAAASRRRGASKSTVHREGPTAGERKVVRLTLQFLADVAIVGMPNAGKSTFLAAVTRAKPKIASYAFTTIVPNLGVWINEGEDIRADAAADTDFVQKLVLCDVPGLVQGASKGVGLGHEFLRHVERCSVLVHLVDVTSPSAVDDYEMINRELVQYAGGILASKPQVVIVNKLDLLDQVAVGDDELSSSSLPGHGRQLELQEALLRVMPHSRLLWMSAKEKQGVENVIRKVATFVQKVNQATAVAAAVAAED